MALLLEIVVGLGIFAGSMLFVMGIFTMSHKSTTSTKNLSVAGDLAREHMEQEIARGYASLITRAPVDIPVAATINGVQTSTVYTIAVEVFTEAPGPPPNNFARKRLLVTVSWREGTGADRSTRLETYVVQ
jgi:hypothetical protein